MRKSGFLWKISKLREKYKDIHYVIGSFQRDTEGADLNPKALKRT